MAAVDSEAFIMCSGCKPGAMVKLPRQVVAVRASDPVEMPNEVVAEVETPAPFVAPAKPIEIQVVPETKKATTTHVGTVLFRFDSDKLQKKDKALLDKVATDIQGSKPSLAGYTCTLGTDGYNNKLSNRRAKAVADYLRTKGVVVSDAKGKGSCCSVSTEKKLNRRVDIEITN